MGSWTDWIGTRDQLVNQFGGGSHPFYLSPQYKYKRDGNTVTYYVRLNLNYYINSGWTNVNYNYGCGVKLQWGSASGTHDGTGSDWVCTPGKNISQGWHYSHKDYGPYTITNTTGTGSITIGAYANNQSTLGFDNPPKVSNTVFSWHSFSLAIPALDTAQLDLNGNLDGVDSGSIAGYGTVNVTVGGTLQAQGVSDYCTSHSINSSYVIDNIMPLTGHTYNGLASGSDSLSGTLNSNKNVRLSFTTNSYTINYDANGGTYSGSSTTYRYNASGTVALSTTLPTRSYASFGGWRYSGVTYQAGGNFPANLAQDVTVVAVWSPVVPTNIRVECLDRETNSLTMRVLYNAIDATNIKLYYKRSQDDNYSYVEIDPIIGEVILNNLDMDTNYDFYAEVTNAAGTGSSLD